MYLSQVFSARNKWVYSLIGSLILLMLWRATTSEPDNSTQNLVDMMGELPAYTFSLFSFAFLLFPLIFIVNHIHGQSFTQFTTSRKKIDFKRFFFASGVFGSIIIIHSIISYLHDSENFIWNFQPIPFLILIGISILLLPIQIGFEEYLMRGYFMQWTALLTQTRWIPLILSSSIFGLLHLTNPEVEKMGYEIMFFYIGTGFLLGIVTLMDDGLELPLGIHFINNFISVLFSTSEWSVFQTPSLFKQIGEPSISIFDIILMFSLYALVIFIFAKKYNWTDWKGKLLKKIETPKQN